MAAARHSTVLAPAGTTSSRYLQRFSVPVEYEVVFTEHVFDPSNSSLVEAATRLNDGGPARLLFVIDANVLSSHPGLAHEIAAYADAYPDRLKLIAPPEIISGGERVKNERGDLDRLLRSFGSLRLDRHCFVVIVGGGALQDMAGYAAAITHRGIRVIRIPTTVGAQNDSGVGVKCGVNAFGVKNFLGAFAPPFAVLNDSAFIASLPARDKLAGMSEAVKVALIRDGVFFSRLESLADRLADFEPEAMEEMIRRSAELHLEHIADCGDPFERGSARPLDFGHWAAHKLETLSGHKLRHGEAVAIGVALDARFSEEIGLLSGEAVDRICSLLERLGFCLNDEALALQAGGRYRVLDGIEEFREHLGGRLTVTMLTAPGSCIDVHQIDEPTAAKCLDWLRNRPQRS